MERFSVWQYIIHVADIFQLTVAIKVGDFLRDKLRRLLSASRRNSVFKCDHMDRICGRMDHICSRICICGILTVVRISRSSKYIVFVHMWVYVVYIWIYTIYIRVHIWIHAVNIRIHVDNMWVYTVYMGSYSL
jgi:hypothetical protein